MRQIPRVCWMMAVLAACTSAERSEDEFAPPAPHAPDSFLFTSLLPDSTGLSFRNDLKETAELNILTYQYFYNGGGVAVGDLDGDSLPEVFFTGNMVGNRLFKNMGRLKFQDVTEAAGVASPGRWHTGCVMNDVDADGDLDIYVCNAGLVPPDLRRNELWINEGGLKFTERAAAFGLDDPGYSTQALFWDFDRDNDLDCFVLNHGTDKGGTIEELKRLYSTPDPYSGDHLYRNDRGHFTEIGAKAGIANGAGSGLGVAASDFNNDGWTDLYVCNDFFDKDFLYLNQHNGTFRDALLDAVGHTSNFSMGCDAADLNNDGWTDLMVADMVAADNYRIKTNMSGMDPARFNAVVAAGLGHQYMVNTLQLNQGTIGNNNSTLRFSEIGQLAGVSNTDWSWAPLFADFDLDGLQELYVTNGLRKDVRNNDFNKKLLHLKEQAGDRLDATRMTALLHEMPSQPLVSPMFRNRGDLTVEDVTHNWGLDAPGFSNGAAYADLDRDGDLDLLVNRVDGPVLLFRNAAAEEGTGHWIRIAFHGPEGNTAGIGARVEVMVRGRHMIRENQPSRGFQSSVEPVLYFGLGGGGSGTVDSLSLRVTWPDGTVEVRTDLAADHAIVLHHADAQAARPSKGSPPLFEDITAQLGIHWRHRENVFDDYKREVLLPHQLSRLGPALAVGDVNGDGSDDIFVGGAKGQAGVMLVQKAGSFHEVNCEALQADAASEDVGAALFDADGDTDLDLYVVSGGNELNSSSPLLQDRLYLNDGKGGFRKDEAALPSMLTSGACVAPQDFDGDGDVDLFVGGRQVPGEYPRAPRSYLLRNDHGTFSDVTAALAPGLVSPGMVTAACWIDIDHDNDPDLAVVGEWMSAIVLRNDHDKFTDIGSGMGLQKSQGWWGSVAVANIDGDAVPDLVLGNLGLNHKYKATPERPFKLYSGDFDRNGRRDIVLAYYDDSLCYPVRGRQCSSQQMPELSERFPSYDLFGRSTVETIYGSTALSTGEQLVAHTFANSTLLSHAGDVWLLGSLPNEAQFSSVNGIVVDDFTGDGEADLLLAGNQWEFEVETPRNDAGTGVLLAGDGKGGFTALPATRSGLRLAGNVKAIAPLTLSGGGRAIVVANNNGPLELIRLMEASH